MTDPSYDPSRIRTLFLEKSRKPVDGNLTMADFETGNRTPVIDASQQRVGFLVNPSFDERSGKVGYEFVELDAG